MKVCLYSSLKEQGGAARVANLLQNFFLSKGVDVLRWDEQERAFDPVNFKKYSSWIWHFHSTVNWVYLLQSLPLENRVIITAHDFSLFAGGCLNPLDCRGWTRDCLDCPLNLPEANRRYWLKKSLLTRLSPFVISPSRWLKSLIKQAMPVLRVKLIPNGVETDKINYNFSPLRYKSKVVLFVAHGGLQAELKGAKRWLFIWEEIKQHIPEAKAIIVGGKEYTSQTDVQVLPYLPSRYLWNIMQKSALLLYPSLADNHPLIILEAMATGLPVLAYRVGGIPEQIQDGDTGFLVSLGKEQEFIKMAIDLLNQPLLLKRIGELARARAEKYFSVQSMGQKYWQEYKKMDLG
ncbi:MAG: glycosyltransferase [Desulfonauticus sp.]|nr:glycosyltransferase [Desulfonauticus sp.]